MTRISKIFFTIIALVFVFNQAASAQVQKNGLTWYTDVNAANKIAMETKKPIFAFFTGSDWCVWCHRLEANVFDKAGFQAWAKKNVVLLMLDFPRNKKLPEEEAKQNEGLQQFFKVQGFPTVWMFNLSKDAASGKFNVAALGSVGYPQAQPGREEMEFIKSADALLKNTSKTN